MMIWTVKSPSKSDNFCEKLGGAVNLAAPFPKEKDMSDKSTAYDMDAERICPCAEDASTNEHSPEWYLGGECEYCGDAG